MYGKKKGNISPRDQSSLYTFLWTSVFASFSSYCSCYKWTYGLLFFFLLLLRKKNAHHCEKHPIDWDYIWMLSFTLKCLFLGDNISVSIWEEWTNSILPTNTNFIWRTFRSHQHSPFWPSKFALFFDQYSKCEFLFSSSVNWIHHINSGLSSLSVCLILELERKFVNSDLKWERNRFKYI